MPTDHADGSCRRSMPTEAAAKIGVGCGADIAGLLPRAHDVVVDLGKAERRCRRRIHEMPRVRALEVAACATACAHRPLCACLQAYVCEADVYRDASARVAEPAFDVDVVRWEHGAVDL